MNADTSKIAQQSKPQPTVPTPVIIVWCAGWYRICNEAGEPLYTRKTRVQALRICQEHGWQPITSWKTYHKGRGRPVSGLKLSVKQRQEVHAALDRASERVSVYPASKRTELEERARALSHTKDRHCVCLGDEHCPACTGVQEAKKPAAKVEYVAVVKVRGAAAHTAKTRTLIAMGTAVEWAISEYLKMSEPASAHVNEVRRPTDFVSETRTVWSQGLVTPDTLPRAAVVALYATCPNSKCGYHKNQLDRRAKAGTLVKCDACDTRFRIDADQLPPEPLSQDQLREPPEPLSQDQLRELLDAGDKCAHASRHADKFTRWMQVASQARSLLLRG